ncbi:MAG: PLP-dependent cysteine synthase family protein, partial [Brevibacterium sp.]
RRAGASTGTGLWAAFRIVSQMKAAGQRGSLVSLICDPGERYLDKYYSPEWLAEAGIDTVPYRERLTEFIASGRLD